MILVVKGRQIVRQITLPETRYAIHQIGRDLHAFYEIDPTRRSF